MNNGDALNGFDDRVMTVTGAQSQTRFLAVGHRLKKIAASDQGTLTSCWTIDDDFFRYDMVDIRPRSSPVRSWTSVADGFHDFGA